MMINGAPDNREFLVKEIVAQLLHYCHPAQSTVEGQGAHHDIAFSASQDESTFTRILGGYKTWLP